MNARVWNDFIDACCVFALCFLSCILVGIMKHGSTMGIADIVVHFW